MNYPSNNAAVILYPRARRVCIFKKSLLEIYASGDLYYCNKVIPYMKRRLPLRIRLAVNM